MSTLEVNNIQFKMNDINSWVHATPICLAFVIANCSNKEEVAETIKNFIVENNTDKPRNEKLKSIRTYLKNIFNLDDQIINLLKVKEVANINTKESIANELFELLGITPEILASGLDATEINISIEQIIGAFDIASKFSTCSYKLIGKTVRSPNIEKPFTIATCLNHILSENEILLKPKYRTKRDERDSRVSHYTLHRNSQEQEEQEEQ